ncbi:MAG: sigma-54-dependent Fis family transcriptional regulator, partial [Candidatus Krumholzibacteria bacterium]|nr:sigma-54-dependent Fis family transcriptional regulator [Candidatus Krumholzibacteria bacterium]
MSLILHLIDSGDQNSKDLVRYCKEAEWKVKTFTSIDEFLSADPSDRAPLLIFSVPDDCGGQSCDTDFSRLQSWREEHSQTQLILLLSKGFSSGDRLALELGARQVLYKPCLQKDITKVLSMTAQGVGQRKRTNALRKRLKAPQGFEAIIGVSGLIKKVIDLAKKVASSDCTSVMITGECGTGKGALAAAIHLASPRSSGPFIEVNCAAIPRNLLESEFFGHEKGAFTDAKEEKIGLFECANGGTIFLDEVGEIDYSLQAKLLKFLDTRVIRRISGTEFLPVDVRLISATNRDLELDIEQKIFRVDLFYRLNVVEINIPPLRERPEDIRPIAEAYTKRFASRLNKGKIKLTDEAIEALEQYSWPGNIRELINIIERAVLLNKGKIELKDLPIIEKEQNTKVNIREEQGIMKVDLPPKGASLEDVEKGMIIAALTREGCNITRAAR